MSEGPQEYGDTYDDDQEFPIFIRRYEGGYGYNAGWVVSMPHQCDEWRIVDSETAHAEAIATLERFEVAIRRARARLEQVGA